MDKTPIFLLAFVIVLSGLAIAGVQNASATTFVEGHITVDTTWTATNSPYVIATDIYVDKGVTLAIEPKTEVKFGGDFSIIVNGNFKAVGTSGNEIIFTSNKINPEPGDWNTIKLSGEGESLHMEHCLVEYAKDGVTSNGLGGFEVTNCELINNSGSGVRSIGNANAIIRGNKIHSNSYGVSADGMDVSGISIIANDIADNTNEGIYLYTHGYRSDQNADLHDIVISDNTISSNTKNGIYMYSHIRYGNGESHIHSITVSGNKMSSNSENGIYIYSQGEATYFIYGPLSYIYDMMISNNEISSNSENGIYIRATEYYEWEDEGSWGARAYVYNTMISDNIVQSNKGAGVKVDGNHHYTHETFDVNIDKNTILTNSQGIVVTNNLWTSLTRNTIAYNGQEGIFVSDWNNCTAHLNDIYRNKYGITVEYTASINAERNYWGDESGPYHESLNPQGVGNPINGKGDLDFIPFLTSPVGTIVELPTPTQILTPTQPKVPARKKTEIPAGEKRGIPGFEAVFSVTGLLVVIYLLKRRDY